MKNPNWVNVDYTGWPEEIAEAHRNGKALLAEVSDDGKRWFRAGIVFLSAALGTVYPVVALCGSDFDIYRYWRPIPPKPKPKPLNFGTAAERLAWQVKHPGVWIRSDEFFKGAAARRWARGRFEIRTNQGQILRDMGVEADPTGVWEIHPDQGEQKEDRK